MSSPAVWRMQPADWGGFKRARTKRPSSCSPEGKLDSTWLGEERTWIARRDHGPPVRWQWGEEVDAIASGVLAGGSMCEEANTWNAGRYTLADLGRKEMWGPPKKQREINGGSLLSAQSAQAHNYLQEEGLIRAPASTGDAFGNGRLSSQRCFTQ